MKYAYLFFLVTVLTVFANAQTMNVHKTDNSTVVITLSEIDSITFTLGETVTDIDGNVYHTVQIGTQIWLVENLKTTRYRNGDSIPHVTDGGTWGGLTTGAYCNYLNEPSNAATFGRLYNWHAVNDSRNIAPEGWHVATDNDWQILIEYLGGADVAGGKLKETGTAHWNSPNTGATNETGFTALGGGYRDYSGGFGARYDYGYWWSSTEYDALSAWYRSMNFNSAGVSSFNYPKRSGFSIRCVKD